MFPLRSCPGTRRCRQDPTCDGFPCYISSRGREELTQLLCIDAPSAPLVDPLTYRAAGDGGSDILDAIVAEGRCGTCGTPWDRVVNVDGKRPVKIEGGCPNEVCVLGDW
jgi:hypothetical protein